MIIFIKAITGSGFRIKYGITVSISITTLSLTPMCFYPLFICECGDFYCSGYYVYIEIKEDTWIINNKYSSQDKKLIEEINFTFQKSFSDNLKKEISEKIKNFCINNQHSELFIGTYGNNINDKDNNLFALISE